MLHNNTSVDWFRNTTWNDVVEQYFNEKLKRARGKAQYLRIQACVLARSHPEVALNLLSRYFALGNDFAQAQAHVDRATALLTLGRLEEAIGAYKAALACEAEFTNMKTQAYVDLPYLIAIYSITKEYPYALQLLQENRQQLTFPVEYFLWHAAYALIAADRLDSEKVREQAQYALKAAACDHSGFRSHPTLGLVAQQYGSLIEKLRAFCQIQRWHPCDKLGR